MYSRDVGEIRGSCRFLGPRSGYVVACRPGGPCRGRVMCTDGQVVRYLRDQMARLASSIYYSPAGKSCFSPYLVAPY